MATQKNKNFRREKSYLLKVISIYSVLKVARQIDIYLSVMNIYGR